MARPPLSRKLLVAAAAFAVALAVGWPLLRGLAPSTLERSESLRRMLERQEEPMDVGMKAGVPSVGFTLGRTRLTEDEAYRIYKVPSQRFVFDELTTYRYRPGFEERVYFSEHAKGYWDRRTNRSGFRRDAELLEAPDLRVVVIGDSHTDGICNNAESYCALVERRLAAARPGRTVEVVNTAVMGYSFFQYLGCAERYLVELEPHVLVVAFYSGNDFSDLLVPLHDIRDTIPPPKPAGYWERLEELGRVNAGCLVQGINSLVSFHYNPHEAELAVNAASALCARMIDLADGAGVPIVFVHVPPPHEVGGRIELDIVDRLREEMGLTDYDVGHTGRMARRLLRFVESKGARVVDLTEAFRAADTGVYWSECHIDVDGHRVAAGVLAPVLERLLP